MTDLRKLARGMDCQVRFPQHCCGDTETTILAHLAKPSLTGSGMGYKAVDLFGAWACTTCHDLIDRRVYIPNVEWKDVYIAKLEGVIRTQAELIKRGVLHW